MEIEKYINTLKKESDKLIDNFKEKLTHIPLGKASPELLKNIKVMYQGKSHFINEIATIEAINEIELLIKPNDISALKPIEKALINSGLDIEVETYENNIIVTYFMLKDEHTALLKELNAKLEQLPEESWDGVKVVTSGIITDNPGLLEVFDNYKVCIVADDVAHESRGLKVDIDLSIEDPMMALADQFARMDEDPILYDPDITKRPKYVLDLAKENGADGCLLFMMNFNDTEEMEYPSLKKAFDEAKVPLIKMGYDQQMVDFGQVKTQLETFNEIVQMNRF